jgi:hypothetical protein
MDEQIGFPYQQEGVFIQRRRAGQPPAPQRQVRSTTQDRPQRGLRPNEYYEEDDDAIYSQRPPSSARRYIQPPEVYTQGNRKIVVHRGPPPKRRFHWMIFMGMVMFVMVVGWFIFTALGYWWQGKQEDFKYGTPFRTFQVDQYVAMGDTPQNPDHFLALNIHGSIEIVQLNTTSPKYDHVYPITTVNDSSIPVFLSFEDTRHTGKLDMLVTIGDSNSYTVVLLNNGTQFTK